MDRQALFSAVLRDLGNREDKADFLPEWLTSAEFRINSALRVDDMVKRSVTSLAETLISPPSDFIAPKQATLRKGSGALPGVLSGQLVYMPSDIFDSGEYVIGTQPIFYTQRGKVLEFAGWTDSVGPWQLDLRYYAELPKLPEDGSTNWLLEKAPHIYRMAMMYFGYQNMQEFDNANNILVTITQEIQFMNDQNDKNQYGSGPLIMRPPRKIGGRHS
jgi:hypothetical protein